eukprot:Pompholyxophrys_punicea_v1_NODE_820_length_1251_cov_9.701255.p1 type:complete len:356 gc:universal NODE_820_length_1251_cov_9.701255:1123-56(-)
MVCRQQWCARQLKRDRSTISKLMKRYRQGEDIATAGCSKGRPRVTTPRQDRAIVRMSERDRFLTGTQIGRELGVNERTVRSRLINAGLKAYVARKKPALSEAQRLKRLNYAQEYGGYDEKFWERVLFSDEKKWMLFKNDGRVWVRRHEGEAYDAKCVRRTVKHGGGNLMFWGCFSSKGPGAIRRIAKDNKFCKEDYFNILKTAMLPSAMAMENGPDFFFLHDNDPKHTANIVKQWLSDPAPEKKAYAGLDYIYTVTQPDLNCIENLWNFVEKRVHPTNLKELETYISYRLGTSLSLFCTCTQNADSVLFASKIVVAKLHDKNRLYQSFNCFESDVCQLVTQSCLPNYLVFRSTVL